MGLNKQFSAFYKTWLSVYLIDVILNILVYTYLIGAFYKTELSKIGLDRIDRDKPLLEIQLVMYAAIVAIMIFFILRSIPKKNRRSTGTLFGGILGCAIFLSHNIFNYTLLKHWSVALVIIDSSWGIILGILTGFLSVVLYDRFME